MLSSQIADNVIYINSAKEFWDELRDRFSKRDCFVCQILYKIFTQ